MKPYPSYKDSGVEWIGMIPKHWTKKNLKYSFKIHKGKIPRETFDIPNELSLPYLSMEVLRGNKKHQYCNISDGVRINDKDLLILWDGSNSGEILYGIDGILSSTMSKMDLIDSNLEKTFCYYLLKYYERDFQYNTVGMGIPHMDGDHLKFSKLIVPPLPEQEQIVSFLDYKTQQIDELIEKTEKKIELLKENRSSLINHCVTKGLSPNVEMKNSGVEWIGKIPSHWEIIKGKYILKILTGNYPNDLKEDLNGISFFKVDDLNNTQQDYFIDSSHLVVKEDESIVPLEENIILFPKRGMTIFTNKVVISKVKSYIDPNLMGVRVFENSDIKFILLCIKNRGLGDICDSSTIPQINNKHIYPL